MDAALHFSSETQPDTGSYRLLELPPDLFSLLQSNTQHKWTIRGRSDDDAVLCTGDKTYTVRSVVLSNAVCVLTPPSCDETGDAIIREKIHEILELHPTIPKLHRLNGILRGHEYDDTDMDTDPRPRHTLDSIRSQMQCSDTELERGLRDRLILTIDEELRPISHSYLNNILELILNTLVAMSLRPESVPVAQIIHALSVKHEVRRDISQQIISWFGTLKGVDEDDYSKATWAMDVTSVVRRMGLGLLNTHRADPLEHDDFVKHWKHAVGESFEDRVDLSLLAGNYIVTQSPSRRLKYFPCAELPTVPTERFADLFLAQVRWRKVDIMPFLGDIALDEKECEKLLMKHARISTDADGVTWYSSRGGTMV